MTISKPSLVVACAVMLQLSGCGGSDESPAGNRESPQSGSFVPDQTENEVPSETGQTECHDSECVGQAELTPTKPESLDTTCDDAVYPSTAWSACEANNFAKTLESETEQLSLRFQARSLEQSTANIAEWNQRYLKDLSWLSPRAGNTIVTPLCAAHGLPCTGDPFRYPGTSGPDGKQFFEEEANVHSVVFYDRECARLSGNVWVPKNADKIGPVPTIVITNGSVQAPETAYRWAIQSLVRAGYAVMSYDPRGQGRSDQQGPGLQQGSNLNPKVFWEGQVDTIDFFRSNPNQPYPHESRCAGTYPTHTASFNPAWKFLDHDRLGIAGHSLGAIGVSVVQGYDAEGAEKWPGSMDESNPVDVAIAWDSLATSDINSFAPFTNLQLPPALHDALLLIGTQGGLPKVKARVPALSFSADYGVVPVPYLTPPDPEANKVAFGFWQEAEVPAYAVSFQGTTHFDFSLLPQFPATSWCPDLSSGSCRGGWGRPAIEYYTVAWFDRWLKNPGEQGYDDADERLIDDAWEGGASRMSFHYKSARDFPDRHGDHQRCENIRVGCVASDK